MTRDIQGRGRQGSGTQGTDRKARQAETGQTVEPKAPNASSRRHHTNRRHRTCRATPSDGAERRLAKGTYRQTDRETPSRGHRTRRAAEATARAWREGSWGPLESSPGRRLRCPRLLHTAPHCMTDRQTGRQADRQALKTGYLAICVQQKML